MGTSSTNIATANRIALQTVRDASLEVGGAVILARIKILLELSEKLMEIQTQQAESTRTAQMDNLCKQRKLMMALVEGSNDLAKDIKQLAQILDIK